MTVPDRRDGISVVIPVYKSSATLPHLVERLDAALRAITSQFEVVLVNDGSPDSSWDVIQQLTARFPYIVGVRLMRNFGQHNALLAGIRTARFPIIVTMDDDLQHPPEEISTLVSKLEEGYDVVYGVPRRLPHSLWRNTTSRLTKRFMATAVGVKGARQISAFRAFRTDIRRAFERYRSPAIFIDVLLSWGASKYTTVKVRHDPRQQGRSNYNLFKLVRLATMLLTGYSTLPLRLASLIGFFFTFFGLAVLVYVVGRTLLQGSIPGFPFLASIIAIFSGAQLFALGIIGEYIAIVHSRLQERPTYVVGEVIQAESRVPQPSHQ